MNISVSSPREFWAGMIYLFFGSSAIVLARSYGLGTATRMGPAYFPSVLGALLIVIGLLALMRGVRVKGPAIEKIVLRPLLVTIGAAVFFAATVRSAGLAFALPVYIMITALASRRFRLIPVLILAASLTLFCCLVFVKALNIPLPLVGPWIEYFLPGADA